MGNQHTLLKNSVYEDDGKYIIPTKIKSAQTTDQKIIKNIFGLEDKTLIARSYWANQKISTQDRNSFINKSTVTSDKLQLQTELIYKHMKNNDDGNQKYNFVKSNVSLFKEENEDQPQKKLSKITSHSIISKLNKFQGQNQQMQFLRRSQRQQKQQLRRLSETRKKEMGDLSKNRNYSMKSINEVQNSDRTFSQFKKKSNCYQVCQNSAIRSRNQNEELTADQIDKIFGVDNLKHSKNTTKSSRKKHNQLEPRQNGNNHIKEAYKYENQKVRQNNYCEQTFSNFDEQNYIQENKQENTTDEFQKYHGLKKQNHNQSLMKIIKQISNKKDTFSSDINSQHKSGTKSKHSNKSHNNEYKQRTQKQTIQNVSQILDQNQKRFETQSFASSEYKKVSKTKNEFMFDLKQVEIQGKSSKKSIYKDQCQQIPVFENKDLQLPSLNSLQNYYAISKNAEYLHNFSQMGKVVKAINTSQNAKLSQNTSQNMYSQTSKKQTQRCYEPLRELDSNIYFMDQNGNKSPKSIISQKAPQTRTRSYSGRIVQTSKATNSQQSPFKSKKFQVQKSSVQVQKSNVQGQKSNVQVQQAGIITDNFEEYTSKLNSIKIDYTLMLKVQKLQCQLHQLKQKQERQKFESRRYSPVKQQRKTRIKLNKGNNMQEQIQNQQNQFCINEPVKNLTSKHRSQYFKLKLK